MRCTSNRSCANWRPEFHGRFHLTTGPGFRVHFFLYWGRLTRHPHCFCRTQPKPLLVRGPSEVPKPTAPKCHSAAETLAGPLNCVPWWLRHRTCRLGGNSRFVDFFFRSGFWNSFPYLFRTGQILNSLSLQADNLNALKTMLYCKVNGERC